MRQASAGAVDANGTTSDHRQAVIPQSPAGSPTDPGQRVWRRKFRSRSNAIVDCRVRARSGRRSGHGLVLRRYGKWRPLVFIPVCASGFLQYLIDRRRLTSNPTALLAMTGSCRRTSQTALSTVSYASQDVGRHWGALERGNNTKMIGLVFAAFSFSPLVIRGPGPICRGRSATAFKQRLSRPRASPRAPKLTLAPLLTPGPALAAALGRPLSSRGLDVRRAGQGSRSSIRARAPGFRQPFCCPSYALWLHAATQARNNGGATQISRVPARSRLRR